MANKFTYDTENKLFILNEGVTSIGLRTDFYSWVKKDWKTDSHLRKFRFPIRAIGGDSLGGGQSISPYYQLLYGWKIRPHEGSHTLSIQGNLITDDGSSPFVDTLGDFNVRIQTFMTSNSLTVATSGDSGNVWDEADGVESNLTPRQALRLMVAALAGKISGAPGGPIEIRNISDTKTRITAVIDSAGNRTSVDTDPN